MTKPIEWTTTREMTERCHLVVQNGNGIFGQRSATPSDLVAALAAMPAEERAEVLGEFTERGSVTGFLTLAELRQTNERNFARAEKAERERDVTNELEQKARRELGAGNTENVAVAARRVVKERNDAERERDEAREQRNSATKLLLDLQATANVLLNDHWAQDGTPEDSHRQVKERFARVVAERGRWADRERTATKERDDALTELAHLRAQQSPREYPLAEGSVWRDGRTVRDDDGVDLSIDQGVLVVRQEGDAATVKIMCYLADVLALAHRRGLL